MRARSGASRALERDDPPYVNFMLKLARAFGPLQRLVGVDSEQLEILLRAKLIVDSRQRRGEMSLGIVKNAGMLMLLIMYTFLGFLCGALGFVQDDMMIFINTFGTMVFLMLLFPLMLDFAAILFDTEDVKLLSPLPVDDRTVLALRVTHIGVYLLALAGSLTLGPLVLGLFVFHPLLLVPSLALALLQSVSLALAGVLVLYLVALKSLDLSRFRDALVYLQVGAFVTFYALTQLGPRLLDRWGFLDALPEHPEWLLLWPPAASGALARLLSGAGGGFELAVAAVGWGVTLGLVAWASWLGREGFVARLAELESSGGRAREQAPRYGITGRLGTRLARGEFERAGWGFFIALSSAERTFKLRTMPMMVVSVMPFLMMLLISREEGAERLFAGLPYAPYLLLFVAPGVWDASRFSESWQAHRMFDVLSDGERREFARGARRAVIVRYVVLPVFLILPIVLAFCEPRAILTMVLAEEVAVVASIWILGWFMLEPFSEKFSQNQARSNFALMFVAAFVVAGLGAAQFGLSFVPHAVPAAAVLGLLLVARLWRRLPERRPRRRRRGRAIA